MQVLGDVASEGFTHADLQEAAKAWQELGCATELIALHTHIESAPPAYVLVVRRGAQALLHSASSPRTTADDLFEEQLALPVDKNAFMKGRVVNKRARYNLCFGPDAQEPNYKLKRGRIVAFRDVPVLRSIRDRLQSVLGPKGDSLMCELNLYYDPSVCGIGFHGDTERRKVVCVRLGASIPLHYRWFLHCRPVGEPVSLSMHHGDMYVTDEKAVGFDWRRRSVLTLRHAAGAPKFLAVKRPPYSCKLNRRAAHTPSDARKEGKKKKRGSSGRRPAEKIVTKKKKQRTTSCSSVTAVEGCNAGAHTSCGHVQ